MGKTVASTQLDYGKEHPDRVYSLKALGLPRMRSLELPEPLPFHEEAPREKEGRGPDLPGPAGQYLGARTGGCLYGPPQSTPDLGEVWCQGPYFDVYDQPFGMWHPTWVAHYGFIAIGALKVLPAEVID
ncbi:hypothetical protein ACGFOM_23285 [Streptomyces sp. NPDC048594]|uniref:hypothetical protein n=1 Tax=Streptomyces sp. NPDC048594 TaxID=3365575 RepID=UPI0037125AB0